MLSYLVYWKGQSKFSGFEVEDFHCSWLSGHNDFSTTGRKSNTQYLDKVVLSCFIMLYVYNTTSLKIILTTYRFMMQFVKWEAFIAQISQVMMVHSNELIDSLFFIVFLSGRTISICYVVALGSFYHTPNSEAINMFSYWIIVISTIIILLGKRTFPANTLNNHLSYPPKDFLLFLMPVSWFIKESS